MVPQWPDRVLFSVRWPFDSQGKGCINSHSQAGTTWEMLSRVQCLPQPFGISWNRMWVCGWDMLLGIWRAQSEGPSRTGKAHIVHPCTKYYFHHRTQISILTFPCATLPVWNLQEKEAQVLTLRGPHAYTVCPAVCGLWGQTYLSTETKAELSVHVCLYLLRKHLKIFFISSFPLMLPTPPSAKTHHILNRFNGNKASIFSRAEEPFSFLFRRHAYISLVAFLKVCNSLFLLLLDLGNVS